MGKPGSRSEGEKEHINPVIGRIFFGFGIALLAIYGGPDPHYFYVALGIVQMIVGAYYGWPDGR